MATFYLLPSRHEVAQQFGEYLQTWFPGLPDIGSDLADDLTAVAMRRSAAYVVFADELQDGADLARVLPDEFGAEPGDRVMDLRNGPTLGEGVRVRTFAKSPLRRSA